MKKNLLLIFTVFLFCSHVFAEKIFFSAGKMSGQSGKKSSKTVLSGNAFIKTDSMEISADSIELSGEDYKIIEAKGNVSGKNLETKMDFTCEQLDYNRDTKLAVLKGSVSLTDLENDVKANAQIIEYDQNTEIAVLQIQIKMIQKDNICTGAYAVYKKGPQMLELSGNAEVKQGEDTFRAQQITLNMKTQDITLSGNVKGSVKAENKQEENPPEDNNPSKNEDVNQPEQPEGQAEALKKPEEEKE
jgi:lipopolysaccharide export system protein LptA